MQYIGTLNRRGKKRKIIITRNIEYIRLFQLFLSSQRPNYPMTIKLITTPNRRFNTFFLSKRLESTCRCWSRIQTTKFSPQFAVSISLMGHQLNYEKHVRLLTVSAMCFHSSGSVCMKRVHVFLGASLIFLSLSSFLGASRLWRPDECWLEWLFHSLVYLADGLSSAKSVAFFSFFLGATAGLGSDSDVRGPLLGLASLSSSTADVWIESIHCFISSVIPQPAGWSANKIIPNRYASINSFPAPQEGKNGHCSEIH